MWKIMLFEWVQFKIKMLDQNFVICLKFCRIKNKRMHLPFFCNKFEKGFSSESLSSVPFLHRHIFLTGDQSLSNINKHSLASHFSDQIFKVSQQFKDISFVFPILIATSQQKPRLRTFYLFMSILICKSYHDK